MSSTMKSGEANRWGSFPYCASAARKKSLEKVPGSRWWATVAMRKQEIGSLWSGLGWLCIYKEASAMLMSSGPDWNHVQVWQLPGESMTHIQNNYIHKSAGNHSSWATQRHFKAQIQPLMMAGCVPYYIMCVLENAALISLHCIVAHICGINQRETGHICCRNGRLL